MKKMIMNFLKDEEGVTAIEYALIAGLVAVASITAWQFLGTSITDQANTIGNKVAAAGTPAS